MTLGLRLDTSGTWWVFLIVTGPEDTMKIRIVRKRQRGAIRRVFIDRREVGALGGEG